ncbi:MAG: sporulation protein YqfD [Bacilli bacterium]|jgi:similar to stage IV sporulation protein|nr:sporulation protein YqfD [Bacilli bacterium]
MSHYIIKIEGRRPNSLLSLLIILKIPFIKKKETKDYLILEIEEEYFQKIKKLAPTYEITILKRTGKAYLIHLYKTKKIFLYSIIFAFLVIVLLTNIIFSVRVVETDKEIKDMILTDLRENGITRFRFKVSYKRKEAIREKILEKEKDYLEWLEIEEIGTMYQVKVIRRINNPKEEELKPRSIVAKKKGRITRIEADYGEVTTKKNDVVDKGDTLISGLIKNKEEIKTKVAARGKVYAEVWYQVNLNLPTIYQEEIKTGKKKNTLEIIFLDKNIFISELFKYNNSISKETVLYNNPLIPFRISFTKKEEIKLKQVAYQEDKTLKKIKKLAVDKLKQRIGNDIKILAINVLKKKASADKIEVELFFKVEEDITSYESLENIDITLENQKE